MAAPNLAQVGRAPTTADPATLIADKGYHSRAVLKSLADSAWTIRIAEPQRTALLRWHGDTEARDAVYANRNRLRSQVGKHAMRQRGEIVERSFSHNLERGGMRRTWLRGRENVHKRHLIHVAGHNLGILMRLPICVGTPKQAAALGRRIRYPHDHRHRRPDMIATLLVNGLLTAPPNCPTNRDDLIGNITKGIALSPDTYIDIVHPYIK